MTCFWGTQVTEGSLNLSAETQVHRGTKKSLGRKAGSTSKIMGQHCTGHIDHRQWRPGHRREFGERIITIAIIIK